MSRILLWAVATVIVTVLLIPIIKILRQKLAPHQFVNAMRVGGVLFALVAIVGGTSLVIQFSNHRNIPNITLNGHPFLMGKTTVEDVVKEGCKIYLMTKEGDDRYLSERDYYKVDFSKRLPIDPSEYRVRPDDSPSNMHNAKYVLVKDSRYCGSFNVYYKHATREAPLASCIITKYYFSSEADKAEWTDFTWNGHELRTLSHAQVASHYRRTRNNNYGMNISPEHYASRFYRGSLNLPYQRAYDVYIEFSSTDPSSLNEFSVAMYAE